jgi:hypothetical protein
MSGLKLGSGWTDTLELLRSATSRLERDLSAGPSDSRRAIEELAEFLVPDVLPGPDVRQGDMPNEEQARRITSQLSAFADLGMTVIDAFSDKFFDLAAVQRRSASGAEGSYEELAVARSELSVSPAGCRAILRRFREHLRPAGSL